MPSLLQEILPNEKFLPTSERMPFPDWIHRAGVKIRGQVYSFRRHEYLKEIVYDDSPDQTFEKGAQVGISTVVLMKGIYVAEHMGMKALYYFQDDAAVSDFSNDRALPMLEESRYLNSRVQNINNVGLKRIGPGSLYLRGLFSKGKAKSVDGDFVIFDEVSEMKEEHRQLARDRIMHSNLQWVFALSQPNLPHDGIDAEFATTDQKYWLIKCPSCGHYNNMELDFPRNFLEIPSNRKKSFPAGATHYRGCSRCEAQLFMGDGVWVARQPSKHRRGYHLSQLYTQIPPPPPFANYASKAMDEYFDSRRSQAKASRFMISIIGFPYGGGNARVTPKLLDECEGDYGFQEKAYGAYMGVDQGDLLTVAIAIRSGVQLKYVWFEETESWERLAQLIAKYGIAYCVTDALPNKHPAKELARHHPGRVSIQYFKGQGKGEELHQSKWVIPTYKTDRTDSLDSFIDKMEMGMIVLPARAQCSDWALSRIEDVRRHLQKLTVSYEEDRNGHQRRVYKAGPNVENHYGMAASSCAIAAYEYGIAPGPMTAPVFRKVANA